MKGVRLSVDSSCPGAMLKLVGGGHVPNTGQVKKSQGQRQ